jgi:hypothetical protein
VPKKGKNWKPPAPRKPTGADAGPPTRRVDRRLEAERRREAIRRAAKRRRRLRNLAVVVAILVVGGGIAAYALTRPTPVSASTIEARLLRQAPAAEKTAGCGNIETIPPYQPKSQDRVHEDTIPALTTYSSIPPVSGPHAPIPPGPLPAGIYDSPPDLPRAIHDLEHAAVIVWYSPDAPDSLVNEIKDFFKKPEEQHKVLVAEYDYDQPGGTLPEGKLMAVAAWHHLQLCDHPSLPVAFQFVRQYVLDVNNPRRYKGDAPEATSLI